MSATISSINYCPVKSVSFQTINTCKIKKNIGIVGDRIFAFAKDLDSENAKLFEKSPEERKGKWNKVLTLKNSPVLNKYNFSLKENRLTLFSKDKEILTINVNELIEHQLLSDRIIELENSLKKKLYLFKNGEFLRVKTLFHLPFLSSGFFSNNCTLSGSRSLANAKILSPTIPIFFLISHISILWNDTDFTGQ